MTNEVELLSPARDCATAKSAILSGADAVYIGGDAFGARSEAANSIGDIVDVCNFAHLYGAKVSLALNTLLRDTELERAEALTWSAYEAGVDSIIVQDMGLLECNIAPLPLHASTQCHTASVDKAKFLASIGFDTIVLARELSLAEIRKIAEAVPQCRLEAFVHGALCVSYSGQCYLSWAIGGRSGNRGECAQPCRMQYSLEDTRGRELAKAAHYLSLRDMNRSANIGEMLDAGVRSFKIEGRLKDSEYVKNVTLYYRKVLDVEIAKRGLKRASYGSVRADFTPNLSKSFNRGFTAYNIDGRRGGNAAFSSPKARGEYIGIVKNTFRGGMFFENADRIFSNADGLMFESVDGSVKGANVSGVSYDKVYLGRPEDGFYPDVNSKVFRNRDVAFEKLLARDCIRKLPVDISLVEDSDSYKFSMRLADTRAFEVCEFILKKTCELAKNIDAQKKAIVDNISKLGSTPFEVRKTFIEARTLPYLKAAQINELRRRMSDAIETKIISEAKRQRGAAAYIKKPIFDASKYNLPSDSFANVLNAKAEDFYKKHGVKISAKAFESGEIEPRGARVMTTFHCILRELGMCKKDGKFPKDAQEPIFLRGESVKLRLDFDCARCGMDIYFE